MRELRGRDPVRLAETITRYRDQEIDQEPRAVPSLHGLRSPLEVARQLPDGARRGERGRASL